MGAEAQFRNQIHSIPHPQQLDACPWPPLCVAVEEGHIPQLTSRGLQRAQRPPWAGATWAGATAEGRGSLSQLQEKPASLANSGRSRDPDRSAREAGGEHGLPSQAKGRPSWMCVQTAPCSPLTAVQLPGNWLLMALEDSPRLEPVPSPKTGLGAWRKLEETALATVPSPAPTSRVWKGYFPNPSSPCLPDRIAHSYPR